MPSSLVTFRTLTDADLIELETFFPEPHAMAHQRRLKKQHRGVCLYSAAIIEGKITAIQLIRWNGPTLPQHRTLSTYPEIGSLFVLPEFRRRGIGSRLLEYSERRIAIKGHPGACLAIKDSNDTSVHMHHVRGYTPVGAAQPNKNDPTEPRTYYVKLFTKQ